MRGFFGLVGLLVALGVAGLVVRKQMAAVQAPVPVLQAPEGASPVPGNAAQQSQQMQQQVKQAMDAAMQARPMPDDK